MALVEDSRLFIRSQSERCEREGSLVPDFGPGDGQDCNIHAPLRIANTTGGDVSLQLRTWDGGRANADLYAESGSNIYTEPNYNSG
jgi:hypothetical protein